MRTEREREGVLHRKPRPSLKELSGGEASFLLFPSILHSRLLHDRALPCQDEQGENWNNFGSNSRLM